MTWLSPRCRLRPSHPVDSGQGSGATTRCAVYDSSGLRYAKQSILYQANGSLHIILRDVPEDRRLTDNLMTENCVQPPNLKSRFVQQGPFIDFDSVPNYAFPDHLTNYKLPHPLYCPRSSSVVPLFALGQNHVQHQISSSSTIYLQHLPDPSYQPLMSYTPCRKLITSSDL